MGDLGVFWVLEKVVNHKCTALSKNAGKSASKLTIFFSYLQLDTLYSTKHEDVKVSDVTFKNKTGKVFAEAKLCLVFTKEEKDLIKDVFFEEVKGGKLGKNLPVVKDSAEFNALGK